MGKVQAVGIVCIREQPDESRLLPFSGRAEHLQFRVSGTNLLQLGTHLLLHKEKK